MALAAPTRTLTYEEVNAGLPAEVTSNELIDLWLAAFAAHGIELVDDRPPELDAVLRADVACTRLVRAAFADPAGRELLLALPGWLDETWQPAPLGQQRVVHLVSEDDVTPRALFDQGDVDGAVARIYSYVRARPEVVRARLVAAELTLPARAAIDAACRDVVAARKALEATVRARADELVATFRGYNLTDADLAELAADALERAAGSWDTSKRYGFWELAHWLIDKAIYGAIRRRAEAAGNLDAIQPRLNERPRVPRP